MRGAARQVRGALPRWGGIQQKRVGICILHHLHISLLIFFFSSFLCKTVFANLMFVLAFTDPTSNYLHASTERSQRQSFALHHPTPTCALRMALDFHVYMVLVYFFSVE